MAGRRCGNCRHFRGPGEHCECPDWVTSMRAVRWDDDGKFCKHHEKEEDAQDA